LTNKTHKSREREADGGGAARLLIVSWGGGVTGGPGAQLTRQSEERSRVLHQSQQG